MTPHDQETVALTHAGTVGAEPPREINVPRQLGSVRLIREIGRGGMGVVWLGHDDMLGRDVAVKFLLGAVANQDDPQFGIFLEGARAAAKLRIPGITAVYNADVVEGAPYIVMECVDGPTLSRVVSVAGALSLPAAWAVMQNLCATVGELHERGIIHRDIKPSNVMLDTESQIFLTDFGVALLRPDLGESAMERANLAGTPAYMAPEMFECLASPRSDTYALGIMFYELLCGTVPFTGSSLDEMKQLHLTSEPNLAPLAERKVESGIIELIERALRKDPKFRFKSGRHMLEAMQRAAIPASIRGRSTTELRAASLKCRTAGGLVPDSAAADMATPQRSLYDHMATIAAKKRANPQAPPVRASGDSSYFGLESDSQPERLDIPGIKPEVPGGAPANSTWKPDEPHDDAPIRPVTVAWIGLAVFIVLAIVSVIAVLTR